MIKKILISILFLLSAYAWGALDYIIMVDTSSSMAPFIDDLSEYLELELVLSNLNKDDNFHMLRFADSPTFEISEIIADEHSTERILKKVGFLKPKLIFGKYTDIISAIEYMIDYADNLNSSNEKVLILLSDGIHDPPPDSPYANMSMEEVQKIVKHFATTIIEKNGWRIHLNRVPTSDYFNFDKYKNQKNNETKNTKPNDSIDLQDTLNHEIDNIIKNPSHQNNDSNKITNENQIIAENGTNPQVAIEDNDNINTNNHVYDIFDTFSKALDQEIYEYPTKNPDKKDEVINKFNGFPKLEFPGDLGIIGRTFTIPFYVTNFNKEQITLELSSILSEDLELLPSPLKPQEFPPDKRTPFNVIVQLPENYPPGKYKLPIELKFEDTNRILPRQGIIQFQYNGGKLLTNFSEFLVKNSFLILIILCALAILALIYALIRSHVLSNIFDDFLKPPEWRDRVPAGTKKGDSLIEMRVDFQNHKIGFRNIHNLSNGKTCSIGGGLSHYLIFLVPIEPHIAEITNDNGNFIFTPLKNDFFIEKDDDIIQHCLDRDIHLISAKGYPMIIKFSKYVSPLLQINNLLHQIDENSQEI